MSNKQAQQTPVARPTVAAPKLSARERRALKNQPTTIEQIPAFVTYGNHKEPEPDSPKVAQARLVLDSISESLGPDADEAIMVHAEKTLAPGTKRCAYHKVAEPVAAFSKDVTHSDGLNSSCGAAQKAQRAGRAKAAK